MSELEFKRYLKEIHKGKKEGLKKIYEYYGHAVYLYALSIVKCDKFAEDICQDVFIKIWDNVSKYKNYSNHKAWIMAITRNTAIDYLRKYTREEIKDEFYIASDKDIAEEVSIKVGIDEALSSLKDQEREVIILHTICDITFEGVSKLLNKPLGTVAWRYREAIKKLRSKITL